MTKSARKDPSRTGPSQSRPKTRPLCKNTMYMKRIREEDGHRRSANRRLRQAPTTPAIASPSRPQGPEELGNSWRLRVGEGERKDAAAGELEEVAVEDQQARKPQQQEKKSASRE